MSDTQKTAEPCVMVIFGATGDLTKRKLFPALYNLARAKFLPENFAIVGVGRTEMSDEALSEFRQTPEDIARFHVRSSHGEMVPLGALVTTEMRGGPSIVLEAEGGLWPVRCREQARPILKD